VCLFVHRYNVTILTPGGFSGVVFTYINVTQSPIIAMIVPNGMSMVTRGYGSDVTLAPNVYSIDPDLPALANQV